ncbi:peptidyl-tRNA hydrolase [Oxobacter pfennigii]|uniref:Peptidyl-tRNA hydrolase n=1 Tax=Oxobacter pfennigii TaxID=36849 RepID=A0A0P8Y826_9CLOT|nr:aminoacyl-tRNA hydrolase [Oxobacter pfennigii]KPU42786.1 peptidyl-tRNA hydrolase [Oxobacter pfennigii]
MYIIAGLGNPGKDYENTRHNAGFDVLDYLAYKNNINITKSKFKALCGEGFIENNKVLLIKPQTYMNASGESLFDAINFYNEEIKNLIVVYDDTSIPLGRLRIRPSGSDGGHNGMKSIIYMLEDDAFPRVRVGIGAPKYNMIDYVLGRFSKEERMIIDDVIKICADSIYEIINFGVQESMNKYNSYKHPSLIEDEE